MGISHISKTPSPILTKFTVYNKKVTCDTVSNLYDCNHGNMILTRWGSGSYAYDGTKDGEVIAIRMGFNRMCFLTQ